MARQYIEPMLATRRSNALADAAAALAPRLPDDVMTTGSTAAGLAQVLKQAGAAAVEVRVVARTPRPGE